MAFSDNFNRANENLDASANWTTPTGSPTIFTLVSNKVHGTSGGGGISLCMVATATENFGNDQKAECVISAIGSGDFGSPAVRLDDAGDGYGIRADGGNFSSRRIVRLDAGVATVIGGVNFVPVNGDTLRIDVIGTTIKAYINDSEIDSVTDSTHSVGQPGMFYSRENNNSTRLDDFVGTDLTAGGIDYTLAADAGAFALAGADVALTWRSALDAAAAAFAMAGTDMSPILGRRLPADAGAFDLAGADAGLVLGSKVAADAGAFDMAGAAAGLVLGSRVAADAGAFDLAGSVAGLIWAAKLAADAGAHAMAGQDAGLVLGRSIAADGGAFDLAGGDAALTWDALLDALAGAYVFTGSAADLLFVENLALLLFPPHVVDAVARRWKVDAPVSVPATDAPGRSFKTDDDL